jgi:uncharacterized membrane protein
MHHSETTRIDETVTVTPSGPYIPHALVTTLDTAVPATVDAFLAALEARTGEDIPAEQVWALWRQMEQIPRERVERHPQCSGVAAVLE